MPLIDNVLFLASVIAIGALIEKQRLPEAGSEVFSYRFQPQKGNLFRSDRTFKAWLEKQRHDIQGNLKIKQVLATDISDFYARINFHRLENLLDKVAPNHGAAQYIKRHIKAVRARQSFGLPVGGSAARLLAELALSDTDRALADDGIVATRFVDDYRIFLHAGESPYDALAKLAEDLGINEGLSLNQAKTRVYSRAAYLKILDGLLADVADEAEGAALDALVTDLYFEDDPDDEELEKLKSMNLLGMLQKEMGKDPLDMGRIKVIFRALKIAKPPSAIPYLADNFSELAMFAREVTLLMQALEEENAGCFNEVADDIVKAILAPPASSVQLIKTWMLELFVRGVVPITPPQLKDIAAASSPLDVRQLSFIRGRLGQEAHFRKKKTAFSSMPSVEQSAFIWGASCLPKDEFKNWLSAIAPMYTVPLGSLLT